MYLRVQRRFPTARIPTDFADEFPGSAFACATMAMMIRALACLAFALTGCVSSPESSAPSASDPDTLQWQSAPPSQQGMDAGFAADAEAYLREHMPEMRGVAVLRRGDLVFEQYATGLTADSLNDVQSVGKSIVSALVGVAISQGRLAPDQKVLALLPESKADGIRVPVEDITLRQLLTMTSGIALEDYNVWSVQRDRVLFTLQAEPAHDPGEEFEYSNAAAHLLSAVLVQATGTSVLGFADAYLFGPLGVRNRAWPVDSMGINTGDGEVRLSVRDMAKFGYLYLRKGEWDGKQVLPQTWVAQSLQTQSPGGDPENDAYGYLWWIGKEGGHAVYFAAGWGGQFIQIVPDLDLVVAVASTTDEDHPDYRKFLSEAVIPAVRD